MSETRNTEGNTNLYTKMARVMSRLERLPKRGFNPHFKYQFVTEGDVLDAVRDAMSAEGMCLFVSMEGVQQEDKRTVVNFRFTFADGESGEAQSVLWAGEAIDSQDKGLAKAATSALKYCLLKTFLISTGDEPDADAEGEIQRPAAPPAAPKPTPAAPEHLFPTADAALADLMVKANAVLAEKGLPAYNHILHVKNALKQGGYIGYNSTKYDEMLSYLISRKEPGPDQAPADSDVEGGE